MEEAWERGRICVEEAWERGRVCEEPEGRREWVVGDVGRGRVCALIDWRGGMFGSRGRVREAGCSSLLEENSSI